MQRRARGRGSAHGGWGWIPAIVAFNNVITAIDSRRDSLHWCGIQPKKGDKEEPVSLQRKGTLLSPLITSPPDGVPKNYAFKVVRTVQVCPTIRISSLLPRLVVHIENYEVITHVFLTF